MAETVSKATTALKEFSKARPNNSIVGGILSVLAIVIYFVFRANTDPRITTPMPSYPEVTLGDVNAPRKADMFALFGPPMDFQVYYGAGKTLAEGGSVYDQCVMTSNWGQGWCLPFTYPPFAAWLASIYSKLSFEGAVFIWQTMSLLIFAVVLGAIIFERASRLSLGKIAFLIILLVATFAFSPVRSSFYWGQVNMLIVGLVAVDFLRAERWASVRENGWRDDRWYAGIGVGLAAAIKVYPAFFGLMFLLQKRWR